MSISDNPFIYPRARRSDYCDPVPVELEDERATLQREFINTTRELARMAQRIEALSAPVATAPRRAA